MSKPESDSNPKYKKKDSNISKSNDIFICPLCIHQIIDTDDQEVSCGPYCCFETVQLSKRDYELLKKYLKPTDFTKSPTIINRK